MRSVNIHFDTENIFDATNYAKNSHFTASRIYSRKHMLDAMKIPAKMEKKFFGFFLKNCNDAKRFIPRKISNYTLNA